MLTHDYSLLVGSYTDLDALAHQPRAATPGEGIYSVQLRRDGTLDVVGVTAALNPAVLIPHPDGRSIYAILETIREEGAIRHYAIEPDGLLRYVDEYRASGRSTCYLTFAPQLDAAIVINYWDAYVEVADVDATGRLGAMRQRFRQHHRRDGEWRQVQTREDHWGNRQVGPHAHCAHFWRNWVFIPDLGENAVFQYRYDAARRELIPETYVAFAAGSGPRHMAMHPALNVCYVSNELFNTVCVAALDGTEPQVVKPRLVPLQYESTLERQEQVSYVSEIRLSPDARFLYVSNRGDDSLAIFQVAADGRLRRIGLVPTGGRFPRHFTISPCGRAVVVANQDSGTVRVFSRDVDSGELSMTGHCCDVPAPNYVRFVAT